MWVGWHIAEIPESLQVLRKGVSVVELSLLLFCCDGRAGVVTYLILKGDVLV
jgi:hypothetical protein